MIVLLLGGDLDAAEKALEANKPREAIRLVGDLARGDDARANWIVGRAYYALKEYEAAVEPLMTASDAKPDDKNIALFAAYACWGSARANRDFARVYLVDALRMAKRSKNTKVIAEIMEASGDYEGALAHYGKLEATPAVLRRIAECYAQLGRRDDAKKTWNKILLDAISRRDLQAAYDASGREQADNPGPLLQWLDKEIESRKDPVWYRLYRGFTYADMQLFAKAIPDLRYAASKMPDADSVAQRLTVCLARTAVSERRDELLAESEAIARRLLEKNPRDGQAWRAIGVLGWWAWANRKPEKVYEYNKLLVGLDPGDHPDYANIKEAWRRAAFNFAAYARRLGHYDESRATYETLLEQDPGDSAALNDLAILVDGMGNEAEAIRLWKRTLEIDKTNMNALENLLTKAWERGDRNAIERYLARGLALARAAARDALERDRKAAQGILRRWQWFEDRLTWQAAGHG